MTRMDLAAVLEQCRQRRPRRLVVASAVDVPVLQAISVAHREGIVLPILCGDIEQMDRVARRNNIDLSPFEIIEADRDEEAMAIALSLVKSGRAHVLMKGSAPSKEFLSAIQAQGLEPQAKTLLSHVTAMACPGLDRPLFLTDCAISRDLDLSAKANLVKNAVALAQKLGVDCPRVAPIAAMEWVDPAMIATVDGAALALMNQRGQLPGCLVDGPMALDIALSPEAAKRKSVDSVAAGRADILLFPNLEAANAVYKALTVMAGCLAGGVIMGAPFPIVHNSRSDSQESKLLSIALACLCVDTPLS